VLFWCGGSTDEAAQPGAKRIRKKLPMKNAQQIPATVPDDQMSTTCFVCQKPIVDNDWFCRVPQQNGAPDSQPKRILLCSPSCAFRYFAFSEIGFSQI
jgi:hypothetical protein